MPVTLPPVPPGSPQQMSMGNGSCTPPGSGNNQIPTQMQRAPVQQVSQNHQYDLRDQQIAMLQNQLAAQQQQMAAMQLSMIEKDVNVLLDDLQGKILIDRPRDFAKLVQLSREEQSAEVQFMLQTRRPIEAPVPVEAVPIHMQALGNQPGAVRQAMPPMQLSLQQAHDMLGTPADPAFAATGGGRQPQSRYDQLVEVIRGRGNKSALDAYEEVMRNMQTPNNGVPVRG